MTNNSIITTPVALAASIDFERLANNVAYYSNGRFSVIIFEHGTCVFPPIDEDKLTGAKDCFNDISNNQSFEVREMDDGNFIVKFTEEIFSVVFCDEFSSLKDNIVEEVSKSKSLETILGISASQKDDIYIGIFARTRLLKDKELREVAKEVVPSAL